jgi:hypothetical protein
VGATPGAARAGPCGIFPAVDLIFALTATKATIGLLVIFVVLFPALVQGILAFVFAQVAGERAENERYREGSIGESQG